MAEQNSAEEIGEGHVSHSKSNPTSHPTMSDAQQLRRSSSYDFLPPSMSELRAVLLGNSWSERSSVGNVILGETKFNTMKTTDCCLRERGQLRDKNIVLINTPDLLHSNISKNKLKEHVENCVRLSSPGPHVFLLVLQPEDFIEEHKQRLCKVLQLFSDQSFDHSFILISTLRDEGSFENYIKHPPLKDMITMCRYRYLCQKNLERPELLTRLGQIAKENNQDHLSCDVFQDEDAGLFMKPKLVLNLVLCGRRGAGKTSAAKVILGRTELHSVSNLSECVKHQGEVCGCWVSLVELPALYGKPQKVVMEESLRCVSLCDPEGVHAFILVLPVASLTDEDKGELETIQSTFGSRGNDFTMILFTVESDPTDPAVVNFLKKNKKIQELCESCGGRSVVLNIKDKQQIPELLKSVEKMRPEGTKCFTETMFTMGQVEKLAKLSAELKELKQRSEVGGDDENQSREPLRMVLIGKPGSGKSATANRILGKKHFKPRITPKPPNRSCEKATGKVDGRPVTLVNTPALFDQTLSEDIFEQEIRKSTNMLAPGPHVFLLVLQIGNFIQEEKDSIELIKKYFGKKAQDFTIIIFTRGDELEDQTFESYLRDCQDFVRTLINDCGGRYHVFNNKNRDDHTQVTELLTKIDTMVRENKSSCYTAEKADDIEVLQKKVKSLLKQIEEIKKNEGDLKRKHEEDVKISEERAKQLKEKDKCINKEREERKRERVEEERRWKKQEETQRQEWRKKLEDSEKRAKSERVQREAAEKKLELYRREMKKDRGIWDREKKELWERIHQEEKQNLEEVKASHRKLQEEHTQRIKHWIYSWIILLLLFLLFLLYYVTH